MQHNYSILADIVAILHLAYILFVVIGQGLILLAWARSRAWGRHCIFRLVHIAAIALVVVEAWTGLYCPLTLLENHLRVLAGGAAYAGSFIGHWVGWLIYYDAPPWVFTVIYTLFFTLVLISFIKYPPRCVKSNAQAKGDD